MWAAKYLPFTDLPEHVATSDALRHWLDPGRGDHATYVLAFGKSQYLAYHVAAALLDVTGHHAILANRVLLTIVAVLFPLSLRSLVRAHGTDERIAILACPLFWCRPLVIGFLPYMAAIPALLFALALHARQQRTPTLRRELGLAALGLLVFYLHVSAFLVLVVVAVVTALLPAVGPRSWRTALRSLLWLAPSLAAAAAWAALSDANGGPALIAHEAAVTYVPRSSLGLYFAMWTHDVWKGHLDEYGAVAFWLLVAYLGAQRRSGEPEGTRGLVARAAPFLCVLVLYLAVPFKVGAGAMLNVRLGVIVALLLLLVPRPDRSRATHAAFVLASLLALVTTANAAVQIHGSQRELGDLDALIDEVRPGARVLTLSFARESAYTVPAPWVHVLAYHRLREGGVASLSFSEMGHWPVRFRPGLEPPKRAVTFWDFQPCLFRNSTDGAYYDYVVSRGLDPFANQPPGPRWRPLRAIGEFQVFERSTEAPFPAAEDVGPCAPPSPRVP
ncbi:MAG: hypothetical protein JWP97_4318 [Labilithrix sp.]|nr:hypothetical protein [Labilithrix sp.]